jgi:small subunit ribosomal protein S2
MATRKGLVRARRLMDTIASRDELALFVAARPGVVDAAARRADMPFVAGRWIPGTLTNYRTVQAQVARLLELERWAKEGILGRYTKDEQSRLRRETAKLVARFGGLRSMTRLPRALVLADPRHAALAVAEARKVRASTVGVGGDVAGMDVAIPVEDESATRAVLEQLADLLVKGKPPPDEPPAPEPRRTRRPRPPPDDEAGTAPVPARLRPRPTPGQARARRRRD